MRTEGIPQSPTQRDEIYGCTPEGGEVVILDPTLGGHVKEVVTVHGNARSGDFNLYRLEYGEGLIAATPLPLPGLHSLFAPS